jgi:hypothetical protein
MSMLAEAELSGVVLVGLGRHGIARTFCGTRPSLSLTLAAQSFPDKVFQLGKRQEPHTSS